MLFCKVLMFLSIITGACGSEKEKFFQKEVDTAMAVLRDEPPEVVSVVLRHWADHCERGLTPAFCVEGNLLGYISPASPPAAKPNSQPSSQSGLGVAGLLWGMTKSVGEYLFSGKDTSVAADSTKKAAVDVEHVVDVINAFKLALPDFGREKKSVDFIKSWVNHVLERKDKQQALKDTKSALSQFCLERELAFSQGTGNMLYRGLSRASMKHTVKVFSAFANLFAEKDMPLPWRVFLLRCVLVPSLQFVVENGYQDDSFFNSILSEAALDALKFLKTFDQFLNNGERSDLTQKDVDLALKKSKFVQKLRIALKKLHAPAINANRLSDDESRRQNALQKYVMRDHELYRCCIDAAEGKDLMLVAERMLSVIAQHSAGNEETSLLGLRGRRETCIDLGWPLGHFARQMSEPKFFWDEDSQYPLLIKTMGSEAWLKPSIVSESGQRLQYLYLENVIDTVVGFVMGLSRQDMASDLKSQLAQPEGKWAYIKAEYEGVMPGLQGGLEMLAEGLPSKNLEINNEEDFKPIVKKIMWFVTLTLLKAAAEKNGENFAHLTERNICLLNRDFVHHWVHARMGEEVSKIFCEDWYEVYQNLAPEEYKTGVYKAKLLA